MITEYNRNYSIFLKNSWSLSIKVYQFNKKENIEYYLIIWVFGDINMNKNKLKENWIYTTKTLDNKIVIVLLIWISKQIIKIKHILMRDRINYLKMLDLIVV